MSESDAHENHLGRRLEVDNVHLKPLFEYFVCLNRYRSGNHTSRRPENYALMDLAIISPNKTLKFLKRTILLTFLINIMLYIPGFFIASYYHQSCKKCIKLVYFWLCIYRLVLTVQLLIRALLIYVFSRLNTATAQEIIYCISVIMSSRGWNSCRRLSIFVYVWYIVGISISRGAHFCSKAQLFTIICYIMTVYLIRFVFMITLYRYSFPPTVDHRYIKSMNYFKQAQFPVVMFSEAHDNKSTSCGICLEEFKNTDELRVLKCHHGYHIGCIDLWFQKSGTCPLCMKCVY